MSSVHKQITVHQDLTKRFEGSRKQAREERDWEGRCQLRAKGGGPEEEEKEEEEEEEDEDEEEDEEEDSKKRLYLRSMSTVLQAGASGSGGMT